MLDPKGISKLANILHNKELQRKLDKDGIPVTYTSVHPGGVKTVRFEGPIGSLYIPPCHLTPVADILPLGVYSYLDTPPFRRLLVKDCTLPTHDATFSSSSIVIEETSFSTNLPIQKTWLFSRSTRYDKLDDGAKIVMGLGRGTADH